MTFTVGKTYRHRLNPCLTGKCIAILSNGDPVFERETSTGEVYAHNVALALGQQKVWAEIQEEVSDESPTYRALLKENESLTQRILALYTIRTSLENQIKGQRQRIAALESEAWRKKNSKIHTEKVVGYTPYYGDCCKIVEIEGEDG